MTQHSKSYEVKVSYNGGTYRAYVRGAHTVATCTMSAEAAVLAAGKKIFKNVTFEAKKIEKLAAPATELWIIKEVA